MVDSSSNPLTDPVSLGEVDRNVQRLREELQRGLANVSSRMDKALDGTVPANVYASDKNAWEYRLSDAEKEVVDLKLSFKTEVEALKNYQKEKENQRLSQRNLIAAAFLFPLLILIINTSINFYFRATGK